jgi:hypothetical protein
LSIPTNIAEGAAKLGPRELRRYLDIALGSLSELSYLLLVGILACWTGWSGSVWMQCATELGSRLGACTGGLNRKLERQADRLFPRPSFPRSLPLFHAFRKSSAALMPPKPNELLSR